MCVSLNSLSQPIQLKITTDRIAGAVSEVNTLKDAFNRGQ